MSASSSLLTTVTRSNETTDGQDRVRVNTLTTAKLKWRFLKKNPDKFIVTILMATNFPTH